MLALPDAHIGFPNASPRFIRTPMTIKSRQHKRDLDELRDFSILRYKGRESAPYLAQKKKKEKYKSKLFLLRTFRVGFFPSFHSKLRQFGFPRSETANVRLFFLGCSAFKATRSRSNCTMVKKKASQQQNQGEAGRGRNPSKSLFRWQHTSSLWLSYPFSLSLFSLSVFLPFISLLLYAREKERKEWYFLVWKSSFGCRNHTR